MLARFLAGLAVAVLVAARSTGSAPVTRAAAYDHFYANYAGEELMRAVNADRGALGLVPYVADPALAAIARDRETTCPSNGSLVIRGRVRDMAERGYLSHDVQGCTATDGTTFSAFDLLTALGQAYTAAGENIASNNYPASSTTYQTGCSATGGSCRGEIAGVPWTVAVAERGWMGSAGHRAALLSTTYRRFGCAAWDGSTGSHVYACYFLAGGTTTSDTAGPALTDATGGGGTFSSGSTPTFTIHAADGRSLLSDGYAALDGRHIEDWAHDHAGSAATISAVAPPLVAGSHVLTWWARDTSGNARSAAVSFSVTGSTGATPQPTPRPSSTTRPSPTTAALPTAIASVAAATPRSSIAASTALAVPPSTSPGSTGGPAGGLPSATGGSPFSAAPGPGAAAASPSAPAAPASSLREHPAAAGETPGAIPSWSGPSRSGDRSGPVAAAGILALGLLVAAGIAAGPGRRPRRSRDVDDTAPGA